MHNRLWPPRSLIGADAKFLSMASNLLGAGRERWGMCSDLNVYLSKMSKGVILMKIYLMFALSAASVLAVPRSAQNGESGPGIRREEGKMGYKRLVSPMVGTGVALTLLTGPAATANAAGKTSVVKSGVKAAAVHRKSAACKSPRGKKIGYSNLNKVRLTRTPTYCWASRARCPHLPRGPRAAHGTDRPAAGRPVRHRPVPNGYCGIGWTGVACPIVEFASESHLTAGARLLGHDDVLFSEGAG